MGSGTKFKAKYKMHECIVCKRKFSTTQALKVHKDSEHKKVKFSTKTRQTIRNKAANAVVKRKPTLPKQKETEASVTEVRKIEFSCPVCTKYFPVHLTAFKHILKYHATDENGQKVLELLEPIRIEKCIKCDAQVTSDRHTCFTLSYLDAKTNLVCLGCDHSISTVTQFDDHVLSRHSEMLDNMFFPSLTEFMEWKALMEVQTKSSYLVLGKCNIKQMYRCTHMSEQDNETTSYLCPSSIIVLELAKGVQVHYYKSHFGHDCEAYELPGQFKKYSMSNLIDNEKGYTENDTAKSSELLSNFTQLMNNILENAAHVSVKCLDELILKAVDMATLIKNGGKDVDVSKIALTSMTDDQICNELEEKEKTQLKSNRKKEVATSKVNIKNEKLRKAESIAADMDNESMEDEAIPDVFVSKKAITPISAQRSVKNLRSDAKMDSLVTKKASTPSSLHRSERNSKSDAKFDTLLVSKKVSTPIGSKSNEKSFNSETQKKTSTPMISHRNLKLGGKVDSLVGKKANTPISSPRKQPSPSPSFNDSYKDFVDSTMKEHTENITKGKSKITMKRKLVVKTKIGQFSPKKAKQEIENNNSFEKYDMEQSNTKAKLNLSTSFTKTAIRYEVKERENDCNILILKI